MTGTGINRAFINEGRRLHLSHGPIDLIIEAQGDEDHVRQAYAQASARFEGLLEELVAELPALRSPTDKKHAFASPIAQRMAIATCATSSDFITPMGAVAGSVADEILHCMREDTVLTRAYVNNGGDIALCLNPGASFTAGIVADVSCPALAAKVSITAHDGIGGIATSGWRGRSHSLGIADAVTVLAKDAAHADAAATLIANEVDLPGSGSITRQPACELSPDSDLDERLVTVDVASLLHEEIEVALASGQELAREFCRNGVIDAAYLSLQGTVRTVNAPAKLAA